MSIVEPCAGQQAHQVSPAAATGSWRSVLFTGQGPMRLTILLVRW